MYKTYPAWYNMRKDQIVEQQLFSTSAAAQYLGVTEISVKKYVHESGRLTPVKVGQSLVFTKDQLDAFKRERGDHLLTSTQAAEQLGVSLVTLRKYTSSGRLPYIRVRNAHKFDPEVIAKFKTQKE